MAVFYKWIKGCKEGSNLKEGLWNYIKWSEHTKAEQAQNCTPTVWVEVPNKEGSNINTPTVNLGHILTDNVDVKITKNWIFPVTGIKIGDNITLSNSNDILQINKSTKISGDIESVGKLIVNSDSAIKGSSSVTGTETITGELKANGGINTKAITATSGKFTGEVSGNTVVSTTSVSGQSAKFTTKCEAEYFNATSDRRAKENIHPITFDALDLLKKMKVYEFNYKNDNNTTLGLIAQELLEIEPKHLSFVSNSKATGINNDYMSIKEDKLLFVLIQAIQEQQKEIELLKEKLQKQ